jgi:hypothetical protein
VVEEVIKLVLRRRRTSGPAVLAPEVATSAVVPT